MEFIYSPISILCTMLLSFCLRDFEFVFWNLCVILFTFAILTTADFELAELAISDRTIM